MSATADRAAQILESLVAMDTVSRNSNLLLIELIEHKLKQHGLTGVRVPNAQGNKANLYVRVGPQAPGGIILSGHTDVVPVDGQKWDTPPFTLTCTDDKLYGRGTSDMKGFLACCLAMVPEILQAALAKPFYLAFSYDEEIGCLGVPSLVEHIIAHEPVVEGVVVGEPTQMEVVTAHKGVLAYETTVYGLEKHSSDTARGVNAVQIAARLVGLLTDMAEAQAKSTDRRFDPPYTTLHVGTIHGGTARNIIPRECAFGWEIRPVPGQDVAPLIKEFEKAVASLEKQMQKIDASCRIETRATSTMPAMQTLTDTPHFYQRVLAAAQRNHDAAVAFGTEAGVFQEQRIPAIVCGPGSIRQAHQPNEYIEVAQIEECVAFLARLIESLRV